MKPEFLGRLMIFLCILLLPVFTIGGQTPTRTQADFLFVAQQGVSEWIRWSDVTRAKLKDDNGGPESFWELWIVGQVEPLIVKNAYAYPQIAERLKDRHEMR